MRRAATVVMSGVSIVVVGTSLQASRQGGLPSLSSAAAGVVQPLTAPTAPAGGSGAGPVAAATPAGPPPPRPTRAAAAARATQAAAPSPSAVRRVVVRHSTPPRPAPPSPSPQLRSATINGGVADTAYGPVQVQITLSGGHITRADAIQYPQGGSRDREINSYAVPQLDSETVQADSGQIDTVSGATYTSDGYRASLQSALDEAHRVGAR